MTDTFNDQDGKQKPFVMGCYGIGIPRLAAAIVEVSHDEKGIVWSEELAPYQVVLIDLTNGKADKIYDELTKSGIEVLYDDRSESAGVKFAEADLLGCPWRAVVSEKTKDKIEVKKRNEDQSNLVALDKLIADLKRYNK